MMKRGNLIAAMAIALLVLASPVMAQINDAAGVGGTQLAPIEGGVVDLYDQLGITASGNGAPDQDFEAAFDLYDAEGADDFIVTFATGWVIQQVETVGTQSVGDNISGVNVAFYADDATFPADTPVAGCDYTGIVPTSQAGGSLLIDLPTDCNLPPGTYWVAIQSTQAFAGGAGGQHFWSNSSDQVNSGAVWRNPLDGFMSGCTDWDRMTTCGVGGGTNPDFLYAVRGQEGIPGFGDDGPNVLEIPTLDLLGLLALFALLGGAALIMLRRRSA